MPTNLLKEIRNCTYCKDLPLGPRPVLSYTKSSKLLIIGQAPGTAVHESGKPWDDKSGERLRDWMGIGDEVFYDPKKVAIVPMGFCYPGKAKSKSGDLPPRPECAELWHEKIMDELKNIELTLLVGKFAQEHYLGDRMRRNLTATVKSWDEYAPAFLPLPHPSPTNNRWFKINPWFDKEIVPHLKKKCKKLLL